MSKNFLITYAQVQFLENILWCPATSRLSLFKDKSRRSVVLSMNSVTVMVGRRVMPHTRPRGIHSSGLSFVVGGKLMKFTLSAQARGGPKGVGSEGQRPRERERERGREREKSGRWEHVLSRVGEPLWSMCRHCTTYVYICMEIIATSAKYIPPNVLSRYSSIRGWPPRFAKTF